MTCAQHRSRGRARIRHGLVFPALLSAALLPNLDALCQSTPSALPDAAAAPPPSSTGIDTSATSESLHLAVGNLVFLNSTSRISRIYIANPAILDSYTANPHQLVITAKAPGVSSVVVWDEHDVAHTCTVSADVGVAALRAALSRALPKSTIAVDGNESRVILGGTVAVPAEVEAAGRLAALFSKDVVNSIIVNPALVPQVRLKVRIVEVDRSRLNQFGINIFNPGGSTAGGATTTQFPTTATLTAATTTTPASLSVSDPLNFLFYSFKANLGVSIKDLENKQILQILAEPTITAVSGQKASFLAGGEFPFPVVQGGAGGLTSISIQFRPYGVKLDFLPEVNLDGTISLKVVPEVSALDYTNAVTISGYTIPALSTRRADTQVILRSGQSFAISGLLDHRTTDILSRTPGITRIPILGALFKSKGINLSTNELIVVVTPTIIDPLHDDAAPEEPSPARPFLNNPAFDKSVPEVTEKH